jgi:hypothetical protein
MKSQRKADCLNWDNDSSLITGTPDSQAFRLGWNLYYLFSTSQDFELHHWLSWVINLQEDLGLLSLHNHVRQYLILYTH